MTINRWLGVAQAQADKKAFTPSGITPGSVWKLRVGSLTYPYTYPATIEVGSLTENDKAQTVVNGLIAAYEGTGAVLGGGASSEMTLSAELYRGKWAIVVTGASDGTPLDVAVVGEDADAASVAVVQLQAGQAARNHIQRIKVPGTPTAGNLKIQFKDEVATVAYNASNATIESALEGLTSIGSGNVDVTGSLADGWSLEFKGTFAGTAVDDVVAWSEDFEGVASYTVEKTVTNNIARQTYAMDALDGDANHFFAFGYDGDRGHLFSGAATADMILAALENVPAIGSGNVAVDVNEDGSFTISLIGEFVGTEGGDLTLYDESAETSETLATTAPEFEQRIATLKFIVRNMPLRSSGTTDSWFRLTSEGNTSDKIPIVVSTATISAALAAATPSPILWDCTEVSGGLNEALTFTLQYNDATYRLLKEGPLVLMDVSNLIGCYAIDVRTTQTARTAKNEVQQISIATDPTGGTFTLTYGANTTAGIAYNASAATIETALTGLASVGASNADVSGPSGGPWIVEFVSSLAAADLNLITGSAASLTIPSSAAVSETSIQTPTGPNYYDNALNWSLSLVPTGSHVITFDRGNVHCRYGITGVAAVAGIDVYRSYLGGIGLPEVKADGTLETLDRYLSFAGSGSTIPIRIGLGDGGSGPSVIRIDTGSQDSTVTILYTQQPSGEVSHTCILAGTIGDLNVSEGSVGLAIAPETSATVDRARLQPSGDAGNSTLEWGESADVGDTFLYAGSLRAGSVPDSLYAIGGDATVRGGTGTISALTVRNATVRYLAGGSVGRQGSISAMTVDADDQALLTSNGHGLSSGSRVYISGVAGVVGLPDAYYTVSVVDANSFALVGTAPEIPYGAVDPATVSSYYETNTAKWGLADCVTIGEEGLLDFSEVAILRTVVAPVLMQSLTAQLRDPMVTIAGLRLRHDPGTLEESLGIRCVVQRDEYSASTATPGNPGGAGGLVIDP